MLGSELGECLQYVRTSAPSKHFEPDELPFLYLAADPFALGMRVNYGCGAKLPSRALIWMRMRILYLNPVHERLDGHD